MWVASQFIDMRYDFPGRLILAALCVIAGFAIAAISMGLFRRAKTTIHPLHPEAASALVTEGIYKFTRNPMYLGLLFLLIGWGLFLANPVNIIILIGFVLVMNILQIIPEERALLANFGQSYQDYKARVRRWL